MELSQSKQRGVTAVLLAVHIVYFIDFTMIIVLGSKMVISFGQPVPYVGYLIGTFFGTSAISGLLMARHLDKFDRKKALLLCVCGQAVSILSVVFCRSFGELILARALAGAFSAPAVSLVFAAIGDLISKGRQGRAASHVTQAFSFSMTFGTPAFLALHEMDIAGWRLPFVVSGAYAFATAMAIYWFIPKIAKNKLSKSEESEGFYQPELIVVFIITALIFSSTQLIGINATSYFRHNLGHSSGDLAVLFFISGLLAIVGGFFVGQIIDRIGSLGTCLISSICMAAVVWLGFVYFPSFIPVIFIQTIWAFSSGTRQSSIRALSLRVPSPHERGRFLSTQMTVQQVFSGLASVYSATMLSEGPGNTLIGFDRVAIVALLATLLVPGLFYLVDQELKFRDRQVAQPVPVDLLLKKASGDGS